MKSSDIPAKINMPFAVNCSPALINQVPDASQIGITAGAASYNDGFVSSNFLLIGAGGIPPFGKDFNGLFNQITAWDRWAACAGGRPPFDAAFSAKVTGYPQNSLIASTTAGALWLSLIDNNTANPDTTFNPANWIPVPAVIDTSVTFTVHGTAGQFSDLNAAFEYLSRFTITHNGKVTLQLAAGQFAYSTAVTADHPSNDRIAIVGATMLAACPTTDASFATNGFANRVADTATNLTMLRTKFATELDFNGCSGIIVTGRMLGNLDGLLLVGNNTAGCSGFTFQAISALTGIPQAPIAQTANGLAAVNFGSYGLLVQYGYGVSFHAGAPIVLLGSGLNGFEALAGSFTMSGSLFTMGGNVVGVNVELNSCLGTTGVIYTECNNNFGVQIDSSRLWAASGGHTYKNNGWGVAIAFGSSAKLNGWDFGGGGNANVTGTALSTGMSYISVPGSANLGSCSPAAEVVGNANSIITSS
jgi:hypothetical protein